MNEMPQPLPAPLARPRFTLQETAGAFGDLGTLAPLAVTLITVNGLNPTMVFATAGALYVAAGLYYRVPMPVQPLKSLSALAIGYGLSAGVVGAGGLLMGIALLLLGLTGASAWLGRIFTRPLVRGIQLGVGLILLRAGLSMAAAPVPLRMEIHPGGWAASGLALSLALAAVTAVLLIAFRRNPWVPAGLVLVVFGAVAGFMLSGAPASLRFGALPPVLHVPAAGELWQAFVLLVLPQLPLTLTNSVVATRDVALTYFGAQARRVTFGALTTGLGVANTVAGLTLGMPVCHGSGGFTAHYRFGARTGGAPLIIGVLLLLLGLGAGRAAASLCAVVPRPVLGVLLVYVGGSHCLLIRDTRGRFDWAVVLATGLIGGVFNHNGYGLAAGAILYAARYAAGRLR